MINGTIILDYDMRRYAMRRISKHFLVALSFIMMMLVICNAKLTACAYYETDENSRYVNISSPTKTVYYVGEKIPVKATMKNPFYGWDIEEAYRLEYLGQPFATLVSNTDSYRMTNKNGKFDKKYSYNFSYSTKYRKPGKYRIVAGFSVEGAAQSFINSVSITIKQLAAPKNLKVTPGKKKATLTWKKATGANKYIVYRALDTGKNSEYYEEYKKIATVTTNRYVDRNVKKGKKYWYYVVSVRSKNVISKNDKYDSAKCSGKIK